MRRSEWESVWSEAVAARTKTQCNNTEKRKDKCGEKYLKVPRRHSLLPHSLALIVRRHTDRDCEFAMNRYRLRINSLSNKNSAASSSQPHRHTQKHEIADVGQLSSTN